MVKPSLNPNFLSLLVYPCRNIEIEEIDVPVLLLACNLSWTIGVAARGLKFIIINFLREFVISQGLVWALH
jgi:hypothetical protein